MRPRTARRANVTIQSGGDLGSVSMAEQQGGGDLGHGLCLLKRFQATVDDPDLDYVLTLTVAARAGSLAVEQALVTGKADAAPLTSAGLKKIALDAYLGAVMVALRRLQGGLLIVHVTSRTDEVTAYTLGVPSELWAHLGAKRRRSPHETLPAIVELYRRALADPQKQHRAASEVAEQTGYSKAHVRRLLGQARRTDPPLLGKARRGAAGELRLPSSK